MYLATIALLNGMGDVVKIRTLGQSIKRDERRLRVSTQTRGERTSGFTKTTRYGILVTIQIWQPNKIFRKDTHVRLNEVHWNSHKTDNLDWNR